MSEQGKIKQGRGKGTKRKMTSVEYHTSTLKKVKK